MTPYNSDTTVDNDSLLLAVTKSSLLQQKTKLLCYTVQRFKIQT